VTVQNTYLRIACSVLLLTIRTKYFDQALLFRLNRKVVDVTFVKRTDFPNSINSNDDLFDIFIH